MHSFTFRVFGLIEIVQIDLDRLYGHQGAVLDDKRMEC